MSLLGSIGAGVAGFLADKKKNKRAKKQYKKQEGYADQQVDIAKYIRELAGQAANLNGDINDARGGRTFFNEATGQYETILGEVPQRIQNNSDAEEGARYTLDQAIRRTGLNDFENMRARSSGEASTALNELLAFKRGVGRVDPNSVASQLRTDRTRAINAGYDDAERAAQTLQLRTGSSAVGDALSALARDRVRSQASIGSPELEGQQYAEEMNNGRMNNILSRYNMFGNEARGFYDAAFTPATYADAADARLGERMKFDLSKLDLAMGGAGGAADAINRAAAGLAGAFNTTENQRVHGATSKLISGLDAAFDDAAKQGFKIFGGG